MVGAVVSSVAAGVLSDKLDRRLVVCLSGLPMTLAALGFALAPDLRVIFIFAALFGLGYGGVFSVGWALALDSVPELGDVARDLGIWGTLSNLPMVIAPAIGALIIAHGGDRRATAIAGCSRPPARAFCLARSTVLAVRNAEYGATMKPNWSMRRSPTACASPTFSSGFASASGAVCRRSAGRRC